MKNWEINKEFLLAIPPPEKTKSYTPIEHSVFINELQDEVRKQGYEIAEERYLPASSGQILTGTFRLKGDGTELSPALGFTNSYNKMRKASLAAMAMVLVCKNGMMANAAVGGYTRKHSGTALEDIRMHMVEVVGSLQQEYEKLQRNMEEMKQIETNKEMIAKLVGDMYVNENLIKATQLGILNKEIHFSKDFKDMNLWNFYNHVTEAFKDNHPMDYDKQMIKFHTYVADKFNLSGSRGLYKSGVSFV